MRVVCVSDLHLDARTAGAPRREDLTEQLERVVEKFIAEEEEAQDRLFVFGGDLADPHRASSCYASAVAVMAATKLAWAGVDSIWITGNHDVVQDGTGDHTLLSVAALSDDRVHVRAFPDVVAVGGYARVTHAGARRVMCLPYPSTATAYDPEAYVRGYEGPAPHLVVGHLSLPGMHPGSETLEMPRGRDYPWPVAAIRERWPSVPIVAGHYHRAQTTAEGVHVVGALGRLTFGDEAHAPSYLKLEI